MIDREEAAFCEEVVGGGIILNKILSSIT